MEMNRKRVPGTITQIMITLTYNVPRSGEILNCHIILINNKGLSLAFPLMPLDFDFT